MYILFSFTLPTSERKALQFGSDSVVGEDSNITQGRYNFARQRDELILCVTDLAIQQSLYFKTSLSAKKRGLKLKMVLKRRAIEELALKLRGS